MKSQLMAALVALVASTACGGSPPPKSADEAMSSAPATSSTADMPPAPSTPSSASTDPQTPAASTAAPVRVVALKLATPAKDAKKVGFTTLEVKDDGSLLIDGKPHGKIAADGLKDDSGKSILTVGTDGAVSGENAKPAKFSANDELVLDNGAKIQVADDGSVLVVDEKGKGDPIPVKFDGVSTWAKREAALIILAMFVLNKSSTTTQTSVPAVVKPAAPKKK
jgi:hypothetical protein